MNINFSHRIVTIVLLFLSYTVHGSQEPRLAIGSLANLASTGNYQGVRAQLNQKTTTINQLDEQGFTPLQEAIRAGHANIVAILCNDMRIKINVYSSQGFTALHYAIARGINCTCGQNRMCDSCHIIDSVLSRCQIADINAPRCSRYTIFTYIPFTSTPVDEWATPLHIAALNGDSKNVSLLLAKGANSNATTYWGKTPLHCAAYKSHTKGTYVEIADLLFRHGANINQEDNYQSTPLYMTTMTKLDEPTKARKLHVNMIKFLLDHGANINQGNFESTPLIQAVMKQDEGVVSLLVARKADLNARNNSTHNALDEAVLNKSEQIQRILLAHGATPTLSQQKLTLIKPPQKWVLYPLHEAADAGNLERIQFLLTQHTIPNCKCTDTDLTGKLPIHYATSEGHTAIVDLLALKCPLIAEEDAEHHTPLYYAVSNGHAETVELLLRKYPENYLNGAIGNQLLTIAAEKNHENIACVLANHGALINQDIQNSLLWGIRNQFVHFVKFLLDTKNIHLNQRPAGNPPPSGPAENQNPLELALKIGNRPMIELLIKSSSIAPEETQRLRSLIQSPVMVELFDDLTFIQKITKQHSMINDDGNRMNPIKLDSPEFKDFCLQGLIVPSLQQNSHDCISNKYSGYYALFNALEGITTSGQHLDRKKFCDFFQAALTAMQRTSANPPYDNLEEPQIQALIQSFKESFKERKVFVEALNQIVIIQLENLDGYLADKKSFKESFTDPNTTLINQFAAGTINKIAIIAGSRNLHNHWFTILATRNRENIVHLDILDSSLTLQQWSQNPLYNICRSDIILFYYILTNQQEKWKAYISSSTLRMDTDRLISSYELAQIGSNAASLPESLDDFIENLSSLKDSVTKIQKESDPSSQQIITQKDLQIIHSIRLGTFSLHYESTFKQLFADIGRKKIQDPLISNIAAFITTYAKIIEQLKKKLLLFTGTPAGRIEEKNFVAGEIIVIIAKIVEDALALKEKIAQKEDSFTSDNFYELSPSSIPPDKLVLINKYLHPKLQEFVNERSSTLRHGVNTILLYGVPGNGKTTVAQALAKLCLYSDKDTIKKPRPFRIIRVPALGTKYQFSKQEQLSALYTFMRKNPNAVILLDEIDALAESRSEKNGSIQVVQQLIDQAIGNKLDIIFIGTTNNDVEALESDMANKHIFEALTSRFQQKIRIENPQFDHRVAIIEHCRSKIVEEGIPVTLSKQEETLLARKTAGFSIRDIETIFILARQHAFSSGEASTIQARRITNDNVTNALESVKRGKGIHYRHIAAMCLKNVALYASPWLSLAHSLYTGYIQGLQRNEDIIRGEIHRREDKILNLATIKAELLRSSALHDENLALHNLEQAQNFYTQELHRAEEFKIHTADTILHVLTAGVGIMASGARTSVAQPSTQPAQ